MPRKSPGSFRSTALRGPRKGEGQGATYILLSGMDHSTSFNRLRQSGSHRLQASATHMRVPIEGRCARSAVAKKDGGKIMQMGCSGAEPKVPKHARCGIWAQGCHAPNITCEAVSGITMNRQVTPHRTVVQSCAHGQFSK